MVVVLYVFVSVRNSGCQSFMRTNVPFFDLWLRLGSKNAIHSYTRFIKLFTKRTLMWSFWTKNERDVLYSYQNIVRQ